MASTFRSGNAIWDERRGRGGMEGSKEVRKWGPVRWCTEGE